MSPGPDFSCLDGVRVTTTSVRLALDVDTPQDHKDHLHRSGRTCTTSEIPSTWIPPAATSVATSVATRAVFA